MRKLVERFERQFPQVFFAFYAAQYEEAKDLRGHAFWLLNNAAFADLPAGRERDCGILCAVDVRNRQLTLAVGYTLTPYLTDEQCFKVMGAAHGLLLESNWAAVVAMILEKTSGQLRKGSKLVKKRPVSLLHPVRQELAPPESQARQKIEGWPMGGDGVGAVGQG